jgi:hypothetical protein
VGVAEHVGDDEAAQEQGGAPQRGSLVGERQNGADEQDQPEQKRHHQTLAAQVQTAGKRPAMSRRSHYTASVMRCGIDGAA